MPRKKWESKNPYCRKSKLSKEAFERVAFSYFVEVTGGWTREDCVTALRAGCEGVFVTRQTMGIYFDKIGEFIWENLVLQFEPRLKDPALMDALLDCVNGKTKEVTFDYYSCVANFMKEFPQGLSVDEQRIPFHRTLMFQCLVERSKATRGFAKGKFYLEYARIVFICNILAARRVKVKHIGQFKDESHTGDITAVSWNILKGILMNNPL